MAEQSHKEETPLATNHKEETTLLAHKVRPMERKKQLLGDLIKLQNDNGKIKFTIAVIDQDACVRQGEPPSKVPERQPPLPY